MHLDDEQERCLVIFVKSEREVNSFELISFWGCQSTLLQLLYFHIELRDATNNCKHLCHTFIFI